MNRNLGRLLAWGLALSLVVGVSVGAVLSRRPAVLSLGETAETSLADVKVVSVSRAQRSEVSGSVAVWQVAFRSCRNREAGQIADLSSFELEFDDGAKLTASSSSSGPSGPDCLAGTLFFPDRVGREPKFVWFDAERDVKWRLVVGSAN